MVRSRPPVTARLPSGDSTTAQGWSVCFARLVDLLARGDLVEPHAVVAVAGQDVLAVVRNRQPPAADVRGELAHLLAGLEVPDAEVVAAADGLLAVGRHRDAEDPPGV